MKKTMMALALTATTVFALAQGGAQQPPPGGQGGFQGGPPQGGFQGGPPQGGFQGGPGMMGGPMMRAPGGPALLMQPDVQKELKLTDDQIQKIQEIVRQGGPQGGPQGQGGRGGFQGGPPQGGQGGGFQGGPPQGGQGGFQGGPPQGRGGQGGPPQGGFQGGPPQGGFQGGPGGPGMGPQGDQRRQEMEKKIKGVLSGEQYTRYQELALQAEGARAILRPEIGEKLNLTDEQRDKIQEIMQANRPQGGPQGQGGRGGQGGFQGGPPQGGQGGFQGGPPQGRGGQGGFQGGPPQGGQGGFQGGPPNFEEMEKRDAELNKKILAVLTSSQKATWEKMLGKPFKFERRPMGQGGPGRGQFGGRGGGEAGRGGRGGGE